MTSGPAADGPAGGAGPGCARVTVDVADAERVGDLLWLHGATAVGERPVAGERIELEAGFATGAEARAAVAALAAAGAPPAQVVEPGPALQAALDAWMAHARPVRAGRIHVRPSWLDDDDEPPAPGERAVVLDPSRAFGSGSHPSTLACLAAVDRWASGASVLDVGCGTGVLAVAAAVLGASTVVAVDVDPAAVAATASNAARNAVEDRVTSRVGSAGDVEGRFDLVLANIGAGAVLAMADDLVARVAPGGRLVVAGLYADRADEVAEGLTAAGLGEAHRTVVDGWACCIHHSPPTIQHTVQCVSG